MKVITAEVVDATHLILTQPIQFPAGETIRISIPEPEEAERLWRERARDHLFDASAEEDALYDEL